MKSSISPVQSVTARTRNVLKFLQSPFYIHLPFVRLEANIPILQSKLSLPPPAPYWEDPSPVSPNLTSLALPSTRRWPLTSLKMPSGTSGSTPVTPVEQIIHTPDEPPVFKHSPKQRPSVLCPFNAPLPLDAVALSPLAYPDHTPPSLSPMLEEPPCVDMASALGPETCAPRPSSVVGLLPPRPSYGRRTSLSSMATASNFTHRARDQPLRMGLARKLSYNHTQRQPSPVLATGYRGVVDDEPLASPLTLAPPEALFPSAPNSLVDNHFQTNSPGTPMATEGSSYFGL